MTTSSNPGVSTPRVLATLAAAGLAGLALSACSPNEHPSDVPGTTPAVVTGDQADLNGLINGDGIVVDGEEGADATAIAPVSLVDSAGGTVGAVNVVRDGEKSRVTVRVVGLSEGLHKAEIRDGACDFAATGDTVEELEGIQVRADGSGLSMTVLPVGIADLNKKSVVVLSSAAAAIGCGVIDAS